MANTMRRPPKWYPPPPPTPRILNFPRRPRRKSSKSTPGKPLPELRRHHRGRKLEALFDEERSFYKSVPIVLLNAGGECERRQRVIEEDGEVLERETGVVEERERMVEVEMLRAECKFLRMERKVALKKLERYRVHMEMTLQSAVRTLVSGRTNIHEGNCVSIDEEIQHLVEKLEDLQRSSRVGDFEVRNCGNFDKQASFLQRRLERFGEMSDEKCVKEIREMAEASLSINKTSKIDENYALSHKCSKYTDNEQLEVLRRKMEGMSKGKLLERMKEEYGSMLSTANSSVASSASNSRRIEFPNSSSTPLQSKQETPLHEEIACSGRCKAIVRRIVEQVRIETEQWSQMQGMLGQVKEEMEEMQASRDLWEDRALNSDYQVQSLRGTVKEWKQKAFASEAKAKELQARLELERSRMDQNTEIMRTKTVPPVVPDAQNEKEKRVLICRLKENHHSSSGGGGGGGSKQQDMLSDGRRKAHTCSRGLATPTRSPFRDIGNLSPPMRQISNAIFPFQSHKPSGAE